MSKKDKTKPKTKKTSSKGRSRLEVVRALLSRKKGASKDEVVETIMSEFELDEGKEDATRSTVDTYIGDLRSGYFGVKYDVVKNAAGRYRITGEKKVKARP
ncbi:MAG: hypothetical protein RX318_07585 [bacterium]|nr:hypothetical protein [bacterium]